MASPSSSTTLSVHSTDGDGEAAMEIDSTNSDERKFSYGNFILPEEYRFIGTRETLSPSMRAASDPNPRMLKAVLGDAGRLYDAEVDDEFRRRRETGQSLFPPHNQNVGYWEFPFSDMTAEYGPHVVRVSEGGSGITSPLLEAVAAKLPQNIQTLLDAGANPNGVPLIVMEKYSAFFLRFRPQIPVDAYRRGDVASRRRLLRCMDLPQISSLTHEELEDRTVDGMAPFWCEQNFIPQDYYRHGDMLPSLVGAARSGSIKIFDTLLDDGADASFWMRPHFYLPVNATESSLSVSSPLHAAIRFEQTDMLEHLLKLGFDPNTMPLANPTRCLTPMMTTIVDCRDFNKEAFDILASHPNINLEIRTPVYDVHILHFAVAKHDTDLLKHVASIIPLKNAGVTALGHTLLHIACLPENSTKVQRRSADILLRIHETRDLDSLPDPCMELSHIGREEEQVEPVYLHYFRAQNHIIKFLWENNIRGFDKEDIHGNNPLHYLAGCKKVNFGIVEWMIEQDDYVEDAWNASSSQFDASPRDLALAGEKAAQEGCQSEEPNSCQWTKDRVSKKDETWRELLDDKNSIIY